MEVIVQIVLMFIFIQFVVVMTIMSVALLLVRPELSVFGDDPAYEGLRRNFAFVIHLPSRARHSFLRLAHTVRRHSVP